MGYYGGFDPPLHSPTFNGASSHDNKIEICDDGTGDRFSHPVNMGAAGGAQQTMYGWESGTHTIPSALGLTLDSFAIEYRDRGATARYDLGKDLPEKTNLLKSHPQKAQSLLAKYRNFLHSRHLKTVPNK